jgi:hypothetical protein
MNVEKFMFRMNRGNDTLNKIKVISNLYFDSREDVAIFCGENFHKVPLNKRHVFLPFFHYGDIYLSYNDDSIGLRIARKIIYNTTLNSCKSALPDFMFMLISYQSDSNKELILKQLASDLYITPKKLIKYVYNISINNQVSHPNQFISVCSFLKCLPQFIHNLKNPILCYLNCSQYYTSETEI